VTSQLPSLNTEIVRWKTHCQQDCEWKIFSAYEEWCETNVHTYKWFSRNGQSRYRHLL